MFEDGRPQAIAVFHQGDAAVTLGLIVDRSQSMRGKTPALIDAVSALLRSTRPDDELFAVDVNDRVSLALPDARPLTNDPQDLLAALVCRSARRARRRCTTASPKACSNSSWDARRRTRWSSSATAAITPAGGRMPRCWRSRGSRTR